jgi:hypothetical protein
MRPFLGFLLAAGVLASVDVAAPAFAQTPLDGWEKLKFGMSPDEARAVPGIAWNGLVKLPVPGGLSMMDSKIPVTAVAKEKFTVRLTFNGASKLTAIDLVSLRNLEEKPCNALTHKLVAGAELAYGGFAPDRKLVPPDASGITYESAGSKSRLMLQSGDSPDTGKTVIATTRHAAGKAMVQVSLNYNAPTKTDERQVQAYLCEVHVVFSRP